MDAQSFTNDKSQFVQYALNIFKQDFRQGLLAFLAFLPLGHKVMNAFGLSVLRVTETEFFYEAISVQLTNFAMPDKLCHIKHVWGF